jgi:hypothetical protein
MSKMALTGDEVVVIRRGILTRRVDAELEASSLFALAGLMLRTLLDPDQLPTALATLDYQVNRPFDGFGDQ